MATQWHTAFAFLLRPLVEQYFDVATNMPVGDLPREADIVLVRRKAHASPALVGVWRRLSDWNILEYKGPTVSPRFDDIDLLVELGLGIHRRLNEEGKKTKQPHVPATEVSFWYLASRLGPRFYEAIIRRGLGPIEVIQDGVWQAHLLQHPIYLVSSLNLPVEPESLPLQMLGVDTVKKKTEMARLLNEHPMLKKLYNDAWASLHPEQMQEFMAMARTTKKGPTFHLMPLVEVIGWKEAIHQLGRDRLIDQLATDDNERRKALYRLLGHLSDSEKNELAEQLSKKKRR